MADPVYPAVAIILLNYNSWQYTIACLESLKTLDYPNARIIVVDNASPNDSVERLEEYLAQNPEILGQPVELICSHENGGFSAGCNIGLRRAFGIPHPSPSPAPHGAPSPTRGEGNNVDYCWLLNNDATVEPDSLKPLVAEAQRTGGLVGSLMLYPAQERQEARFQQVGTRFNFWTGSAKGIPECEVRDRMPVQCLTGASLLIPRAVWETIGPMDKRYFLYFEDADYTIRATREGFSATVATGSRVYHEESATTGKQSPMTQYYYQRNRLLLVFRFGSWLQKLTVGDYSTFRLFRLLLKYAGCVFRSPEERAMAAQSVQTMTRAMWDAYWSGYFFEGFKPHNEGIGTGRR